MKKKDGNGNKNNLPWKTPKTQIFQELGPYLHLGMQLTITVALGVLLGWWLDNKFETKPILVILCSLFAVAVAMYQFFKQIAEAEKQRKNRQDKKN